MDYRDRISLNPQVMLGKPCIKGTRITVEFIIRKLSEGMTFEEFTQEFSHITRSDILAALAYSADVLACEELVEELVEA